jgi:hypothetical protein
MRYQFMLHEFHDNYVPGHAAVVSVFPGNLLNGPLEVQGRDYPSSAKNEEKATKDKNSSARLSHHQRKPISNMMGRRGHE